MRLQPVADATIGRVIAGRFQVVSLLGAGGMGVVYAADHLLLRTRCAVKLVVSDSIDPDAHERFLREARLTSQIRSEHVVSILDLGETEEGTPFMVMELLEGEPLESLLARTPHMPIAHVIEIALQICEGLAAAHEKDIIHRDLKPQNIFVCRTRTGEPLVKILDFGLSKKLDSRRDAEDAYDMLRI